MKYKELKKTELAFFLSCFDKAAMDYALKALEEELSDEDSFIIKAFLKISRELSLERFSFSLLGNCHLASTKYMLTKRKNKKDFCFFLEAHFVEYCLSFIKALKGAEILEDEGFEELLKSYELKVISFASNDLRKQIETLVEE